MARCHIITLNVISNLSQNEYKTKFVTAWSQQNFNMMQNMKFLKDFDKLPWWWLKRDCRATIFVFEFRSAHSYLEILWSRLITVTSNVNGNDRLILCIFLLQSDVANHNMTFWHERVSPSINFSSLT